MAVRVLAWSLVCGALAAPAEAQPAEGDAPRIAVLQFLFRSPDDRSDASRALTRELVSILAEDGRVEIVDDSIDVEPPVPESGETRDAALRRRGAEWEADYLVTGRATQLVSDGAIDLAVRLTPARAGLASSTQVVTARDLGALQARLLEVAERIVDRVVGAPPARVVGVDIRGAPGFEQQLLGRLGTQPGAVFDPLVVRADLAELRSSALIVSAQSSTESVEDGIVVRFDVVLADPSAQRAESGERLVAVRVRGNRRIEAAAIRNRITSRVGDPLDQTRVARDLEEIQKLGFFRDVRAFSDRNDEGPILIFEVEENPLVRQISIAGNDNVDGDDIRDALTLTTGATLDYPLLFENRQRIEALYRAQGYYLASVSFEIERLGDSAVGIHFDVEEGEKQKLQAIEFEGNEAFDDDTLTEGFQTKTWKFYSLATSWFDNTGTYSEPLFLQDLRGIERRYSDAGYLQARVGEPRVVADGDGLIVRVEIDEGQLFRVGAIDVVGDSTVDIASLRDKLKLKRGDVFNRSFLNDDIASLTEHYQDRGFYFAQITPLSNLSAATEEVDVQFEVRKGPLYFIRRIEVGGNSITVDPVVRREVPIVEGELYSQRKIELARRRVEGLGYFEEVDFQIEPTDEPDQLDLKVSVVERPTGSFSFGAGFSSQDGLVVTGSLAQSNLFGRGYGANISLDIGRQSQRFFVNLSDPYFLGSTFSLSTTFSRTSFNFQDFEQDQIGADFVLGHALTEDARTRGFLRYSFNLRELIDDRDVNAAAVIQREVLQDQVSSSLVGLSVVADTRNDRLAPTDGYQYALSLEGSGLGGFSRFARLEARGAYFLGAPDWMFDRSTFVVASRAGWAIPFNRVSDFEVFDPDPGGADVRAVAGGNGQTRFLQDIDDDLTLPLTERYFLGGLGQFQLRGFRQRSVGPRRAILRRVAGNALVPLGVTATNTAIDGAVPGECRDDTIINLGDGDGLCNSITDREIDDFDDLDETDVVGGNKFIASTFEYRFPISETVGLQGVVFIDAGNAFDERQLNLLDVTEWRYGTGAGVQWFSPFGPLAVVLGFPLDGLSVEDSPVFEFSIGGSAF